MSIIAHRISVNDQGCIIHTHLCIDKKIDVTFDQCSLCLLSMFVEIKI